MDGRTDSRVVDAAVVAAGVGFGAASAVPLTRVSTSALHAPGGLATLAGDVTAMSGTYLLLIMVLLAARIPTIERAVGQDRLIRWHRWLSPAPLLLISAHAVLTVLGDGEAGRLGFWTEAGSQITTIRWILAAVVAWALFVAIAAASIRAVRRRVNYDKWWLVHLYTYLALTLSLPHQVFDGTDFGNSAVKTGWILLWLATAGVVIVYRIGLPVGRTLYHDLRVVSVKKEGPGVFSVVFQGRHLDRLAVSGGQYFSWRILDRDLWWHSHPLSLSAMPSPPYLRVTVKVSGDTTAEMVRLQPGTRVGIEGPYGTFTDRRRTRRRVALIGAGVGITPLRALVEDIPAGVDVVAVQRASDEKGLVLGSEMRSLVAERGGRWEPLVGARRRHPLDDPRYLHRVVPDLATRDVYICGPEDFTVGVASAAEMLGVPVGAIHKELFEY